MGSVESKEHSVINPSKLTAEEMVAFNEPLLAAVSCRATVCCKLSKCIAYTLVR